jgi:hypothetical protein
MGYSLGQITEMCDYKCNVWEQKLKKNKSDGKDQ